MACTCCLVAACAELASRLSAMVKQSGERVIHETLFIGISFSDRDLANHWQ
jgi:hypothetical protein